MGVHFCEGTLKSEVIANRTFFVGITAVAASTAILPRITGYGTVLFLNVVLGAWSLVASASSDAFADRHQEFLWPVAAALNVLFFGLPGGILLLALRRRWPRLCVAMLSCWLLFYLACLFFLFPATDGP